ncbi:MAG: TolC family protein [Desulfobacteraceae bacterium]|nr:TolC family protein [Desulfobacteraceae bacterium]
MKSTNYLRISVLTIILMALVNCAAIANEPLVDEGYSLVQLYKAALDHAEQIGIASQSVALADYVRRQALSVLKPRLTAAGAYTRYSEEKNVSGVNLQPEWDGSYGLTISQSFTLNGRELTALRIAEQSIEKNRSDLASVQEAYLFSVASAFYDVAKAQQTLIIAETNVKRLKTHRDAVTVRLELADVTKTEMFRTQAELATAEANLIQADNQLKDARAFLARLTGLNELRKIRETTTCAAVPAAIDDLSVLKNRALANRPELKSFALTQAIAENEVKYAKGAYWPRLDIQGSWMRLEQKPEPAFDESIYAGATLTVDLFDGGLRRSIIGEARIRQRQAILRRKDAEKDIFIQVEQAWRAWQTQQGIIKSFESELNYSRENYNAVAKLFKHGMANSVDVMDANTVLVTSQRKLSDARYDLQLAALAIQRATGTFLTGIKPAIGIQ